MDRARLQGLAYETISHQLMNACRPRARATDLSYHDLLTGR